VAKIVGSGPHKFAVIEDWARLPDGWSAPMASVAVDSQDRIYGFSRGEHPVIVFDKEGTLLHSWGEGLFSFPHAIRVDAQDNVWIVDRNNCQVFKFTPQGKLLLTLGKKGYRSDTGAGEGIYGYKVLTHPGGPFNLPTDVFIDESGDIFISDGYSNCQVHRFSPEGELRYSWGMPGRGAGEFRLPHGVWIDRRGRVLIADRENDRVQVFTREGAFIAQWPGRLIGPANFWIDDDDVVYLPQHNGGIFTVLTLDGEVLASWGDESHYSIHGVAGDSDGNIYFVQPLPERGEKARRLVKYVRA
jgi:streptogramin lyase